MKRLLRPVLLTMLAVAAFLVGAFAVGTVATAATLAPLTIHTCSYDGHHNTALSTETTTERGPPAVAYDYAAAPSAGDHGSRGASPRSQAGSIRTHTTYDHTARSAQPAGGRATTRTASGGHAPGMRAVLGVRCAANAGERSVAIGEDMANRVEPFAKKIGADTYKADPSAPREMWMENNRSWIRKQMEDGCTIYDCGPAPGRANFPGPTSPYYKMELDALRDYPNYIRVWLGEQP